MADNKITLSEARIMLTKSRWEERCLKRRTKIYPLAGDFVLMESAQRRRKGWQAKVQQLEDEIHSSVISRWLS